MKIKRKKIHLPQEGDMILLTIRHLENDTIHLITHLQGVEGMILQITHLLDVQDMILQIIHLLEEHAMIPQITHLQDVQDMILQTIPHQEEKDTIPQIIHPLEERDNIHLIDLLQEKEEKEVKKENHLHLHTVLLRPFIVIAWVYIIPDFFF